MSRNGVAVARFIPEPASDGRRHLSPAQENALAESVAWLRRGWNLDVDRLDRAALYDEARDAAGGE